MDKQKISRAKTILQSDWDTRDPKAVAIFM